MIEYQSRSAYRKGAVSKPTCQQAASGKHADTVPEARVLPNKAMKMATDSAALLARIIHRMEALGIQSELKVARRSGCKDIVRNIRRAADAKRPYAPTSSTLAALAAALQTDVEWLVSGKKSPQPTDTDAGKLLALIEGIVQAVNLEADQKDTLYSALLAIHARPSDASTLEEELQEKRTLARYEFERFLSRSKPKAK